MIWLNKIQNFTPPERINFGICKKVWGSGAIQGMDALDMLKMKIEESREELGMKIRVLFNVRTKCCMLNF
jgi:hypothetical protein